MKFISVDYQGDFALPDGKWYQPRPCESFINSQLISFLQAHDFYVSEIISDYRLPRPSETQGYCIPGEKGYNSVLPDNIKRTPPWIKSMNSPVWIRDNGGLAHELPGIPYSDPEKFSAWLRQEVGLPGQNDIIIFGLTLDCCVLCLAQELYFRGYKAHILYEAVDTYTGSQQEKAAMFQTPLPMWAQKITWNEIIARQAA